MLRANFVLGEDETTTDKFDFCDREAISCSSAWQASVTSHLQDYFPTKITVLVFVVVPQPMVCFGFALDGH